MIEGFNCFIPPTHTEDSADSVDGITAKGVKDIKHKLPRLVYASSLAVYRNIDPGTVVTEKFPIPRLSSSYGAQKMICEYLLMDHGLINGLILRFPMITVRPGKLSGAASSLLSVRH